jgi:RHS repeat-associated protein
MKKTFILTLCLLLGVFAGTSFATEVTLFGPNQFVRTPGSPDVFTDSFAAISGSGMLIVKNGAIDGNNRIADAISTASVHVNGEQIFGTSDFNQNVYLLQAPVNLTENNSITVELASSPGSYLTIEVTEDIDPPTVSLNADPETILLGGSATLSWSSTTADTCTIEPGIGSVGVNGSVQVSPTETTIYTITATGLGGTAMPSVTVTVTCLPPTVSISAIPETILPGESATLTWSSANADTCVIEPGIGAVAVNGSIQISPTETTIFTITATGLGGMATAKVEVAVILERDLDNGFHPNSQLGGDGVVGERICIFNGNVVESRLDVQFSSPNGLGFLFQAAYNSQSDIPGSLGFGWSHTYSAVLNPAYDMAGQTYLKILDQTGRAAYFKEETAGVYKGEFNERSQVRAESGEYVWYRLDGSKYDFSATGQLLWMDDEKGNRLVLGYDAQDRLQTVTDISSSRVVTFNYNAGGLMETISGPVTQGVPSGVWVTYGYDANQNLTSVTYADGSGFNYTYSDPNDMHNLTEKRDKASHLLNTWGFDTQDRAVSNFSVKGKGVNIQYTSDTQVDVTEAYGTVRSYAIADVNGRKRVTAMQGSGGAPYIDSNVNRWVYDSQMNLIEAETIGGTIYQYLNYDARGNPGTIILADGTSEERVIAYTYHPNMNVPLTRTEASVLGSGNKETIFDYDDDGDTVPNESPSRLPYRVVEKGFTKNISGTIVPYEYINSFTHNSKGQILGIDGPLPGNGDTTSFSYNGTTGDLLSITRPLVGITSFSNYDAAGQVGQVTDVNGQSESFTYDGRGRITIITHLADGSVSIVSYNTAGLPDFRTDEDEVVSNFEYDTIYGRLSKRIDHEGNYITYNYDAQGNMIEKSYYDPSDNRTNWKRSTYQDPAHSMPGKLFKTINPDDTFTKYEYDSEGNIASVTDPNTHTTYYGYNALNRLTTVIQPGRVVTSYDYDVHGNLSLVMDAESHVTTYEYDDMGRVVATTSPDTGTVSYAYDEAGNLTHKTDAKGISVGYAYDLLNRLTHVGFPDSVQDIDYTYDTGANGMGRKTGMTDPFGSTTFGYDARGRLVLKTCTLNGNTYSIGRTFTPGSRVISMAYPTGRTVDYTRNSIGKISGVSTTGNGNTTTLINNLSYLPFGPSSGLSMGTGSGVSNVFDELYRTTVTNPGAETERTYTYDANGNLTYINVTNDISNKSYTFDALNRLVHAEGSFGTIDYTYDGVGNRLTKVENNQTSTYNYASGTNRLQEIAGSVAYKYDANGNITGIGNKVLTYNQNNRLVRVEENSTILGEYVYNGLGQRVIKTADGVTTIFIYDFDGNLIAESQMDGTIISEYLYMGKSRAARVDAGSGEIFYFHNDHLGTPELMTDESGNAVWGVTNKPFGEAIVKSTSTVNNNFRLPGQFFDEESGLHYNYFRDYHPGIGRYIEADPIGMKGGINLYLYCANDPVNSMDPDGQVVALAYYITQAAIGGITGAGAGFVTGITTGGKHKWLAAIAGGTAGGVAGTMSGLVFGGTAGGAIGGAFGGAISGGVTKRLSDPNPSNRDMLMAGTKGAVIGLITGTIGGKLGSLLKNVVGASGAAVEIAKDMITAPIALGLGLIDVESAFDIDKQSQEGINVPTIPNQYTPLPAPELQFDPGNPDEIDPNSSISINVIGGCSPYTWSVSGNGFSLQESQTTGLTNTLITDEGACGTATITVRGCNDTQITADVKCTVGDWNYRGSCGYQNIYEGCGNYGCNPFYSLHHSTETVYYSNYKYDIEIRCSEYCHFNGGGTPQTCFDNFFVNPCCCMFVPYGGCNDGGLHKCAAYDCLDTPTWIFDEVEGLVGSRESGCPNFCDDPYCCGHELPGVTYIPYYDVYEWTCSY